MSKAKKAEIGDIFLTTLPDGRHGAIKIIDHIEKSYLIATLDYIGTKVPSLENIQLSNILTQKRFSHRNTPAVLWYDGKAPSTLVYLGNLPVTDKERHLPRNTYGGKWTEKCGMEVFLEWRWDYDRENYEKEVKEAAEKRQALLNQPKEPKEMMSDELFWKIIDSFDWQYEGDDKKVLAPAVSILKNLPVEEIQKFEETLSYKLYLLDTKEHAKNIGEYSYDETQNYFSADIFLYIRCAVVVNGKDFYNEVLKHPKKMPKDLEFESLLYLASTAYELKTGRDFDCFPNYSYETFSNEEAWK